ncbi:FMN-binding negative transcriptional regulator [Macrococcoides bohemicum]|uniref:FMN-binding negative transcriptional regulator n=1 Tax=Macrococcoides bohemicum TaxID=1903056 RepID=A0AAJ4TWR5_9STAP|nr:FMN-binding negative transcriptional regulator [Macrococcus bohemicus]QYA42718.1 FMN-binding negative transcriptional regulator [Macrococcus bohemicus]TDL36083.1 FMN-binding negative transcriptional regulator [Macrococcus bohemicus]
MFLPKLFKVEDFNALITFVLRNPFATVISSHNDVPYASQVPVLVDVVDDEIVLSFHLARPNPQNKTLTNNDNVLIQFTGAHGYVSSSWYEQEEVSTWNYQAAQLKGECAVLDQDELIKDLKRLTDQYETGENARTFDTLSEDVLKQAKGVIGYKVKVREASLKYKLSQNRNDKDYKNIVLNLRDSDNQDDNRLADEMEKIRTI